MAHQHLITRYMAPTQHWNTTHGHTMSNPNTNALAIANKKNQSSHMRVVHIGKDAQPVTLPIMTSMNSHPWKKSASFDILKNTVDSLVPSHTVADIIALVANELQLNTGAAFQEAQSAAKTIVDDTLQVENLEPLSFLSSTGKVLTVDDVDDLDKRPADFTFMKFR